MRLIVYLFFVLFLLFPYLIFVPKTQYFTFIDKAEFLTAFLNTTAQSAGSAFLCLFVGWLGGMSLLSLKRDTAKKCIFIFMIPTFLPTLYVLLSVLSFINPFPFGVVGIMMVHTLIYAGFSAVMCYEIIYSKISKFSELALLEGAGRFQFLKACLLFLKRDLFYVFLSHFIIFFTSFSVPLVVGKNTLIVETLIFEKIKIYGEYGHALAFTLIESLFLLILTLFVNKIEKVKMPTFQRRMDLISIPYFYLIFLVFSIGLIIIPFARMRFDFSMVELALFATHTSESIEKLKWMSFNTLWISLGVGGFVYILSLAALFISDSKSFRKSMLAYVVPSTALVGFSLLVLDTPFLGSVAQPVKLIWGLSFLMLPMLYRFRLLYRFEDLAGQLSIAQTMGGSSFFNYFHVTLPQIHKSVCFCAGLAGFWAASDFALSQFIFQQDDTWSLFIYSMMNSYKLERASLFIFIPLIIGAFTYSFFQGLHYVTYQKRT